MKFMHLLNNKIPNNWNVLDIGGGARPFRRANSVIDLWNFEDRYSANTWLLNMPERYTKETWYQFDICDPAITWNFKDEEFDCITCSHTMEDLEKPIKTLEEIQRISKRGYIEIPSRYAEQMYNIGESHMQGYIHHHWIVVPNSETQKVLLVPKMWDLMSKYRIDCPSPHQVYPIHVSTGFFWNEKIEFEFLEQEKDVAAFYEETVDLFKSISDPWSKTAPYIANTNVDVWNPEKKLYVVSELEPSEVCSFEYELARLHYEDSTKK